MKILFFFKDTVKKTAGVVLTSAGLLLLLIAIFGFITDYNMKKSEGVATAILFMGFSLCFIIPGVALFRSGQRMTRYEEKLKQIASLLKAYRRLSVGEIAQKTGFSEVEVREMINTALDLELIKGHIDRSTDEFFMSDSLDDIKSTMTKCPNCGAAVNIIIHKGETGKCPSCGGIYH